MSTHGISSDGKRAMVGTSVPFVLATIAAVLRFISRRSSKNLGADDWCCLWAYINYVALYVTSLVWVTNGHLGQPSPVQWDELSTFLKFAFTTEILYTLVCPAVKLSFLLFYARIFDTRAFRISLYAVVTAIMLWFFASFFATILQCSPVQGFWELEYSSTCVDRQKILLGTSSANVVLNFAVVIMPIPIVWHLDTSLAQKVILFAMLCLGSMITVFSILRTYYVHKIDLANVTQTIVDTIIWTSIEPGMTIFCASLPSIPHLIAKCHEASQNRQFRHVHSRASSNEEIHRPSYQTRDYSPELIPHIEKNEVILDHVRDIERGNTMTTTTTERTDVRYEVLPLPQPSYYHPDRDTKRWSARNIMAATKQFTIHSLSDY